MEFSAAPGRGRRGEGVSTEARVCPTGSLLLVLRTQVLQHDVLQVLLVRVGSFTALWRAAGTALPEEARCGHVAGAERRQEGRTTFKGPQKHFETQCLAC